MQCLQTRYGLVIGFPEHLEIVAISDYGAIANAPCLQVATLRTDCPLLLSPCPDRLATVSQLTYSAVAKAHPLQFTAARTESSQSAVSSRGVAWYRLPTQSLQAL
jgi:hypothetical protein